MTGGRKLLRARNVLGLLHRLGLNAMDVQLYTLVIATLTSLWSISRGDAGLLATSTLLA
jgi:hypothetical protein